jgi:hypothetical protein
MNMNSNYTFFRTEEVRFSVRVFAAIASYLANANGDPLPADAEITETCFIKTATFLSDRSSDAADYAESFMDDLADQHGFERYQDFKFYSIQDETGESTI